MTSNSENNNRQSALNERDGIVRPEISSAVVAQQIIKSRRKDLSAETISTGILNANITMLSRGITMVESSNPKHLEKAASIISACLPYSGKSIRIGITGVPGVGKSSFIESFGTFLTALGHKVAVLAVDPSSSVSYGSILGDKTRMEELVKDKNAYIRPSASGSNLGGVARKTRESITLCEAYGFDIIIIETVGVGQSETAVHSMVDFFLLLKITGAGDELQGIKRGIMEMADAIAINKADGENIRKAKQATVEFNRALHLFPAKSSGWMPKVTTCSAITKEGIDSVWKIISDFMTFTKANKSFDQRRKEQNQYWMIETIEDQLKSRFYQNNSVKELLEENKKAVLNNELSPFAAAQLILKTYFGKSQIPE